MAKFRLISISVLFLILSGCGDFRKLLGNDYYWWRTNQSNQIVIHDKNSDGSFSETIDPYDERNEYIIDSNVIMLKVVKHYIVAYRVETDFYDRRGEPPPGYGYHVIDKESGEIIRSLSFKQVVEYLGNRGLELPYSLCRAERNIFQCL